MYLYALTRIKHKVHGKKIFVSFNEIPDVETQCIVEGPSEVFLLTAEILESINHSTICRLFDKSMFLLRPDGILHDDVLLFVTDAVPSMVKAGRSIMSFYPKCIHVTCLAHALHRVVEEVRVHVSQIDDIVSNIKKIFVKVPSQRELFK